MKPGTPPIWQTAWRQSVHCMWRCYAERALRWSITLLAALALLASPLPPLLRSPMAQQPSPPAASRPELVRTLTSHKDAVGAVAFAPSGKQLASGSADKTVKLWDPHTGRVLQTLTGHHQPVNAVAFSPDGKVLASGSNDTTVKLWDVQTGQAQATLTGHKEKVSAVAFSPDGKVLASGSDDTTVKLWDVQTGQARATLTGQGGPVEAVAFAPSGSTIVSGGLEGLSPGKKDTKGFGGAVTLWDAASRQVRWRVTGSVTEDGWLVWAVAFSPDGKTVVSASAERRRNPNPHELFASLMFNTVRLWDTQTGKGKRLLEWPLDPLDEDRLATVAVSPDGQTLATGGTKTVKLWDAQSGQAQWTLTGRRPRVLPAPPLAFSPDGALLASGSRQREREDDRGKTLFLWRLK